jgi:hypothetical protein
MPRCFEGQVQRYIWFRDVLYRAFCVKFARIGVYRVTSRCRYCAIGMFQRGTPCFACRNAWRNIEARDLNFSVQTAFQPGRLDWSGHRARCLKTGPCERVSNFNFFVSDGDHNTYVKLEEAAVSCPKIPPRFTGLAVYGVRAVRCSHSGLDLAKSFPIQLFF